MGRYFVNLSRLDMVLVIQALEHLREDIVYDSNDKECYEINVLLSILKDRQDGGDPKLHLAYKNTQQGCAKVFDNIFKNVGNN